DHRSGAEPLRRVSGGGGQRSQASQSHEVVGGTDHIPGEVDTLQSAVARLAEATYRFHPPENFFNPFAHLLTGAIARPARGASVDGAASAAGVLRDVGRDALRAQRLHTLACVIAFVGPDGRGMKAARA